MAIKVIIDAGHGGFDNGATFNGRREKDDNLNLAFELGGILKSMGYDVAYTRTDDVYDSPADKARIANQLGGDYLISLHRNSASYPNQYNGVQTLIYDSEGIKRDIAESINQELEQVGYQNINIEERPNLAVLNSSNMPAVLVEAGFIDSSIDNALFDGAFRQTAQAIADGFDKVVNPSLASRVMANLNPALEGSVVDSVFAENHTQYNDNTYHDNSENNVTNSDFMDSTDNMNSADNMDNADSTNNTNNTGNNNVANEIDNSGSTDSINNQIITGDSNNSNNINNTDDISDDYQDKKCNFRLLIGIYKSESQAKNLIASLKADKINTYIVIDDNLYEVCYGCYDKIDDSKQDSLFLKNKGYSSLLIRA